MNVDWIYIQANFDWLGHIVEGLVIALVVSLLAKTLYPWRYAAMIGLAFAIGHFHGREKRDFELAMHMKPPHLDGYKMWEWNWDQLTDFWPTMSVLAMVMYIVFRYRPKKF